MNNTKEPAYPLAIGPQEQFAEFSYWPGMTKREAFVMAAMQGMLASGMPASTVAGRAIRVADETIRMMEVS